MTILTCPFSEQDEDSSGHVILFLEIPVLVLSSILRAGLPNGLVSPSDFPTKTMYAFLLSSIRAPCTVPRLSQFSVICSPYNTECKWWSSSLCGFLQPLVTYSTVQIPSSAPCLGSPSASAETLNMRERSSAITAYRNRQNYVYVYFKFCFLTSWQLLSYSNNTARFQNCRVHCHILRTQPRVSILRQ